MGFISLFIPEKSSHRIGHRDPFWNGRKKPFMIAAIASFMLLQILFLVNMSYLFGSLFKSEHRVHNLNILTVDYDGGVIGKSLQGAITQLKADTFPTFDIESSSKYPEVEDIVQAVRRGDHWAAVFSHAGASERLAAALEGGDAAATYDPTNTITYVWNQVRYPAVEDATIKSSMSQLVAVARIAYNHMNGTGALQTLNKNDPAALQAFLNPIQGGDINIMPTTQGTRVLYNTVAMVMPIIMQFFFLMAINGVSAEFNLYSHLPMLNNGIIRLVLSLSYTFVGSLCWAGYIWAFREDWSVGAGQFFCTWVIIWLFMHINFAVIDVATGFIPMKFLPFFVLTWVILNVTSTIWPFELAPGFYRWGYALPAHEVWQVLIQIWSGGAVDRLYQALPILFTWEIVFLPLAVIALNHRCAVAEREHKAKEEERRQLIMAAEKGKADEMGEGRTSESVAESPVEEKVHSFEADVARNPYSPAIPPPV
ncbi:hypothetical protein D6C86_00077 [Aureobasidium pullulans]|uniref:DUF3533 domain-containing protein n=1 Tax=Aureobasidium pullulans TaxID=5580 RepID=A0A4S9UDK7_AURPU|nr:hypothetical protein D6C94_00615 [Aureobasidium pullulans]THZ35498.1 hypothetical protein D6C87_09777 [Aureobasidium pullulans]THZ67955.1 hypothetical protein D6C86_00077 [Aureobasidium pullulans]THZ71398.1 hypothetical protein D6C88_07460 [Aureobasidium pullulans]